MRCIRGCMRIWGMMSIMKPDKPVSFCGGCGKHYAVRMRECPTCEKTLVVWRPANEPDDQRVRRWWQLVNFHTRIKRA